MHANDYYKKDGELQSIGEIDNCLNRFRDFSRLNETFRGGVRDEHALSHDTYEEDVFKSEALSVLERHDTSRPLFLFYSFHLVHSPLEVPSRYLDRIDDVVKQAGGEPFDSENRRTYAAMVLYLDEAVGEIESKLRERGMWNDTVLVFLSDNGGPIYEPGAANNWPLRYVYVVHS